MAGLMTGFFSLFSRSGSQTDEPASPSPEPPNNLTRDEWLALYEEKKPLLTPLSDLNAYFTADKINGYPVYQLNIGSITLSTGKLSTVDPLGYVSPMHALFLTETPTGTFPLTLCVAEYGKDHYRNVALMIAFSDITPESYLLALNGKEDIAAIQKPGQIIGFSVDCGLATVFDKETRQTWCDLEKSWPDRGQGEFYEHILEKLRANAQRHPKFQRDDGDWLIYTIPGTNYTVPIVSSGWGDGVYPTWFGFDADGAVCRLVIEFIELEQEESPYDQVCNPRGELNP